MTTTFASLSGPDFLKLSRQQIKALSLDELQLLVLRSQKLLSTALFKPVQCLFEVMPDEFVLSIFLEWLHIEVLSRLDIALTNHYYRDKYLHVLQKTEHKGLLSESRNVESDGLTFDEELIEKGYKLNSGVAEWLEDRNIFMRSLKFHEKGGKHVEIPAGFLARTGQQLLKIGIFPCTDENLEKVLITCPRLEEVKLNWCRRITDKGAFTLAKLCCPKLHTLDLYGTDVTDDGLIRLGEVCRALKKIKLWSREGEITDIGLTKLAEGCPKLEEFIFAAGDLTDKTLFSLAQHCPALHTVNVGSCRMITDDGVASLAYNCVGLHKLDLSSTKVSDTGLAKLAEGCPSLEYVNLNSCINITDRGAASLAQRLQFLFLGSTQITDFGLATVGERCRDLRLIDLSYLAITDRGLRKLAVQCSMLKEVILNHCTQIKRNGLASLSNHCLGLETLTLRGTLVANTELGKISCKALKQIDLHRSAEIRDSGLKKLVKGCPVIGSMSLSCCTEITNVGVSYLVKFCSLLYRLDLSFTGVTDIGLARLGEGCKALKHIVLKQLRSITDTGLLQLAQGCPKLEVVDLSGCVNITEKGITSLLQQCPGLRRLECNVTKECKERICVAYPALFFRRRSHHV